MRTLVFRVIGQQIEKDPGCDFTGLVAGTSDYLQARFLFSGDWNGCKKAASFWCLGGEHAAPIINGVCTIPPEALTRREFSVSVTGARKDYRIRTGKVKVQQEV
ncbi:MAG: hypothetical protein Q4C58_14195 [Eubacteriales bacterium]|nr:hypothetical protein [Eubacteriales bacterium]